MGLLDNFNFDDPATMGLLSAGLNMLSNSGRGGNMNTGQIIAGGAGAGMQGAQNVLQARAMQEMERRKAEHENMQLKMNQQEYDMRSGQIQDKERGRLEQMRVAQLLASARQSGAPLDYQSLAMQGVPVQTLKDMADSGNIGLQEVARTVDTTGENGSKIIQGMDKFGRTVGQGMSGYVPPVLVNQHDKMTFVTPSNGLSLKMGMSPESAASNALGYANLGVSKERLAMEKENSAASAEASIPPETLQLMAAQYRAGDTSVMQNLGRGAQGATNIVALRNEIAKQAKESGMGGADIAAKNAEYFGLKAGQRTLGTKTANIEMAADEAYQLIPLAKEASDNVARSGFLPFGKAQMMFDDQTNNPEMRKFAAANNSLVNVYARAISPSGVPTVSDKEHGREMLSKAYDQKSYNATLEQMQKEIEAARSSPKHVRQAMSEAVSGKESAPSAPSAPVVATMRYNPTTGKLEKVK